MTCLPSQNASSPTANALRKSVAAKHMRNKTDINDCKNHFSWPFTASFSQQKGMQSANGRSQANFSMIQQNQVNVFAPVKVPENI